MPEEFAARLMSFIALPLSRQAWVDRCARRLAELLPGENPLALVELAEELWIEGRDQAPEDAARQEAQAWR